MVEQRHEQGPLGLKVFKPEELDDVNMERLKRLLRLRRDCFHRLNRVGQNLVDRSIAGVYADCVDSGKGGDAQTLMDSFLPEFLQKTDATKDENKPAKSKAQE